MVSGTHNARNNWWHEINHHIPSHSHNIWFTVVGCDHDNRRWFEQLENVGERKRFFYHKVLSCYFCYTFEQKTTVHHIQVK
jgi:hypothetical protein